MACNQIELPAARDLLHAATSLYDNPSSGLRVPALECAGKLFASGGSWMARALAVVRGTAPQLTQRAGNLAGFLKYGVCLSAAALVLIFIPIPLFARILLALFVFYLAEAQFVFLFPLLIEGDPTPWRTSLQLTVRAGGTLQVMRTVAQIAALMIFGGFMRHGFVRSWCIGCLAVVIWYTRVKPL